jgi:hypothetical protein
VAFDLQLLGLFDLSDFIFGPLEFKGEERDALGI